MREVPSISSIDDDINDTVNNTLTAPLVRKHVINFYTSNTTSGYLDLNDFEADAEL